MEILSGIIIGSILFALAQITAFIVFIVKFNIKFETWRIAFEKDMLEMKTDIEDHKLAFEKRFSDFNNSFSKQHDNFCHDNNSSHSSIMKEVGYVKDIVSGIREQIGELRGSLETHMSNGGNIHTTSTTKRRPPSKR